MKWEWENVPPEWVVIKDKSVEKAQGTEVTCRRNWAFVEKLMVLLQVQTTQPSNKGTIPGQHRAISNDRVDK